MRKAGSWEGGAPGVVSGTWQQPKRQVGVQGVPPDQTQMLLYSEETLNDIKRQTI